MRYIVLVLLACAAIIVSGRPPIATESEERPREDAEYETGDEAEDDDSLEDNESSFAEQESAEAENEQEEPMQHPSVQELSENLYSARAPDERASRDNGDNFPGYKTNKNDDSDEGLDEMNPNSEYETTAKQRDSRFNEQPDDQPNSMPHLNRDDNNLKQLGFKEKVNKRNLISRTSANDESDILFENHHNQRESVDKNEYNNNNKLPDNREDVRYSKKYSLQDLSAPDETRYETRLHVNRDRRATQETNDTSSQLISSNNNVEVQDNNAEDEEAAIKRHVKKLSAEELQELLNSLSDDKKELLKKIMENDVDTNNDINKREITKKAGAAPDETANLESSLFDASKLQEGSSGDSNLQTSSTELTESSKQPNPQSEVTVLPVTKTLEATNGSSSSVNNEKSELTALGDDKSDISANKMAPISDLNNQIKIDANIQEPKKTENKREINSDELANVDTPLDDTSLLSNNNYKDTQDLSNEPNYVCSQDGDLSQLMDNESQLNDDNGNINKRETYLGRDADFSESIKSLEESFPNSNSYDEDDPYAGSDMAPLVRVKRKNSDLVVKKRAAGILPDAKVAYFPYRAENDDEDNDEGSEFDDEGFYDRNSNLAKPNAKDEETSHNLEDDNQPLKEQSKESDSKPLNNNNRLTQTDNIESDTSLGSDTDSVLSGVEGVDDNLMYNSGSRSRRTAEISENIGDKGVVDTKVELNRPIRSTPLAGEDVKAVTENYVGLLNYRENDAFGALPRNYEGELGRYKRIRRVKQPPQDMASSST